jgi:threonine dehydratase
LLRGVRSLLFEERVVAEAAGAAATAAYLQNPANYSGRTIVLLVTGANLPNELLLRAIMEGVTKEISK